MDPSNRSHIAKMFMDYMNHGMDEELVRLYFKSNPQEDFASSNGGGTWFSSRFTRLMDLAHIFGVAGSNNDINVLNQSDVFNDVMQGRAAEATFVKSVSMPQGDKRKLFAQYQQGARKDIERAFGVLQSRFAIIRNSDRSWNLDSLKCIMDTCIILHNMIVDDERATYGDNFDYSYDHQGNDPTAPPDDSNSDFQYFLRRRHHVRDTQIHRHLQQDLIEHI
ncbi:uncharacterized protein [Medicago truncatula]|uniref:uncharacterized protein n=1 Tax=Medicago truncatula TaxID=3880 RepID=UPI000D2F4467|nr:uncharacterized protein LOC112417207 [Medicago truncatula]